jgi:hypothetical protein
LTTLATLSIDLKADASGVSKGLHQGTQEASHFGGMVKQAIGTMGGFMLANAAMNVVGSAWHALTGSVIDLNSNIEQTTNVFRTLMGSASMAKAKVTELFDFAARSPFTVQSVEAGALILQKLGGNALNSSKNLEQIGNVAAGLHVPFESMASTIARFHMILDAGMPINRAIRPLMMMGAISAETAAKIMALSKAHASHAEILKVLDASFGRFSGAMDRQGGTWEGLTKTFNDTLAVLGARTLKPFFALAEQGLGQLNKLLGSKDAENFANSATKAILGFVAALKTLFPTPIVDIAKVLVGDLKAGFKFLNDNGPTVKAVMVGIAGAFIALEAVMIGQAIWESTAMGLLLLANSEGIAAAASAALGASELLAMWPLLLIVVAIGAVIAIGYLLITHWSQVSAAARALASMVGAVFSAFGTKVHAVWNSIVAVVEKAAKAFYDRPFYYLALVALLPILLLAWMLPHLLKFSVWFAGAADKAGLNFLTAVGNWLSKLPGSAQTFLLAMLQKVLSFSVQFANAAQGLAKSIWSAITTFDWIKLGYNLIEGIKNGITNGVLGLLGVIKNVGGQVIDAFKSAFGIHSPSRPMFDMGQNLSMALGGGIQDKKSVAHGAFDSLIGGMGGLGVGLITGRPTSAARGTSGVDASGRPTDMTETNALLRKLIAQTAPPTGQVGVASALYKAVQGSNRNRLLGLAGAH